MNNIDQSLFYFNSKLRNQTGDIGCEVELEGDLNDWKTNPYWVAKNDNSLRNGIEFVLARPVPFGDWGEVVTSFANSLAKCRPQTSIRTSTHFHINVGRLSTRQIYNAVLAYYMLEELLVRQASANRIGNLFCLRMSDAEGISTGLHDSIVREDYFKHFGYEAYKYGALNLAAPIRYGSLEFRFLEAIWKPEDLTKWMRVFYQIVHNGAQHSPERLLSLYEDLTASQFVLSLVPSGDFLINDLNRGVINDLIHTNYDNVYHLARVLKRHDRFQLPRQLWHSDDMEKEEIDAITEGLRSSKVRPKTPEEVLEEAMDEFSFNDVIDNDDIPTGN